MLKYKERGDTIKKFKHTVSYLHANLKTVRFKKKPIFPFFPEELVLSNKKCNPSA